MAGSASACKWGHQPRRVNSLAAGGYCRLAGRPRNSFCQESRHDPFFPALWVQGLDDPSVSPLENIKIYRAIVAKMGADRVAEFLRF